MRFVRWLMFALVCLPAVGQLIPPSRLKFSGTPVALQCVTISADGKAFASGSCGGVSGTPSLGTQVVGNGSGPAYQTKPVIDARDIAGVDCTGAIDSGPALTAYTGTPPGTNDAISGKTLSFGGCQNIKLATTWTVYNQAGFVIDGLTRSGAGGKGIHVTWTGGAAGTMLDMEYVDGFQVQGFYFDGGANAGAGIVIDKNGAGSIWNTTDGRIINSTFTGANQNFIGVSISPVSTQNVEDIRVEDSAFSCNAAAVTTAAVGIQVGNSANAKNLLARHNNIQGCLYGVYVKNGSIQIKESEFTNNGGTCTSGVGADIRIDSNSDTDFIEGNLTEGSLQGINFTGAASNPVIVRGNHIAAQGCEKVSSYWFNIGTGSSPWTFEANAFVADSNMVNVIGTTSPQQGLQIYTRGNIYPNSTFNPWWTNTTLAADLRMSEENLMTYAAKTGSYPQAGSNYPSPFQVFRGYFNGSTANPDDFAVQNIPAGAAGTTGGTFLIKHQQGATGTEMFGWDGSYPGINVAQIPTPVLSTVTPQGSAGSTSYTYAIVAYGPLGNTAGSSTVATATGNATLTTSNFNQLAWVSVAGATKYCIWRTASSGTPSSIGNIGCVSPLQINFRYFPNVWGAAYAANNAGVRNPYLFNDTGLAGDSAALPASNTTGALSLPGQLTSTLATGTPPLVVASTTNIPNLNASSLSGATFAAPGAIGGGTPSTGAFTTLSGTSLSLGSNPATTGPLNLPFNAGLYVRNAANNNDYRAFANIAASGANQLSLGSGAGAGSAPDAISFTLESSVVNFLLWKNGAAPFAGLNAVPLTWGATAGAPDLGLSRDGPGILDCGNGLQGNTTCKVKSAGYISAGTKFTTNAGCTEGTLVGGATAGKFTVGQGTACTVIITMGDTATAPNGWACAASDQTAVPAVAIRQTASTTTTASLLMTVATNDVVSFHCIGY